MLSPRRPAKLSSVDSFFGSSVIQMIALNIFVVKDRNTLHERNPVFPECVSARARHFL